MRTAAAMPIGFQGPVLFGGGFVLPGEAASFDTK